MLELHGPNYTRSAGEVLLMSYAPRGEAGNKLNLTLTDKHHTPFLCFKHNNMKPHITVKDIFLNIIQLIAHIST